MSRQISWLSGTTVVCLIVLVGWIVLRPQKIPTDMRGQNTSSLSLVSDPLGSSTSLSQAKIDAVEQMTTAELLQAVDQQSGDWLKAYQSDLQQQASVDGVAESVVMFTMASAYGETHDASYLEGVRQGAAYYSEILQTAQGTRGDVVYFEVDNVVQASAIAHYALAYLELSAAQVSLTSMERSTLNGMLNYIADSMTEAGAFYAYYLSDHRVGCWEVDYNNGWSMAVMISAYEITHDRYYLDKAEQAAAYMMQKYPATQVFWNSYFYSGGAGAFRALYEQTNDEKYKDFILLLTAYILDHQGMTLLLWDPSMSTGRLSSPALYGVVSILDFLQQELPEHAPHYTAFLVKLFSQVAVVMSDQADPQNFVMQPTCGQPCGGQLSVNDIALVQRAFQMFRDQLTQAELEQPVEYSL